MTIESRIRVETPEGHSIPVELFRPKEPNGAAVIVLSELFGVNDDIRRISRRFADNGYLAVMPDLADGWHWSCLVVAFTQMRLRRGRAVDLVRGVAEYVRSQTGVDRVGAAGFCMGGGFAMLLAIHRDVDVAGVFYGEPGTEAELSDVPIFAGYGERDTAFCSKAKALRTHLERKQVDHELHLYPGVGHSYMNQHAPDWMVHIPPMHVGYNEAAAEDSWSKMLAFFRGHLVDEDDDGLADT